MRAPRILESSDYARLLQFRTGIRTFLKWSKDQAAGAGLAPAQHQLLLAIRGHHDQELGPTVGDVARYLLVRPNTAAELVGRAAEAGLVRRSKDPEDARAVRLLLSKRGEKVLRSITEATLEELDRLAPSMRQMWTGLEDMEL